MNAINIYFWIPGISGIPGNFEIIRVILNYPEHFNILVSAKELQSILRLQSIFYDLRSFSASICKKKKINHIKISIVLKKQSLCWRRNHTWKELGSFTQMTAYNQFTMPLMVNQYIYIYVYLICIYILYIFDPDIVRRTRPTFPTMWPGWYICHRLFQRGRRTPFDKMGAHLGTLHFIRPLW